MDMEAMPEMIDISDLVKAWGLVKSGSLDMSLKDEGEVLTLELDSNRIVIDIINDDKLKEYLPLLMLLKDMGGNIKEKKSDGAGGDGSRKKKKARLDEMFDMLGMLKGAANELAASGKSLSIRYKGADVILIGKGARSLSLSLVGFNNMQIKRRALALKLGLIFKDAIAK